MICFIDSSKFRFQVSSNSHSIEVQNLTHFSHYSITVQACREKILEEDRTPSSCSTEKMENMQTLPLGKCRNEIV